VREAGEKKIVSQNEHAGFTKPDVGDSDNPVKKQVHAASKTKVIGGDRDEAPGGRSPPTLGMKKEGKRIGKGKVKKCP